MRGSRIVERMSRWDEYESQGASAAREGKTREDCPYDREREKEAWNFWVYGNANEQGKLVKQFMAAEGVSTVYTTTANTPENLRIIREWTEKAQDADRRMRKKMGWNP